MFYSEANFLYAESSPECQLFPSRMMARHDWKEAGVAIRMPSQGGLSWLASLQSSSVPRPGRYHSVAAPAWRTRIVELRNGLSRSRVACVYPSLAIGV